MTLDPLRDPLKNCAVVPQKYVDALERQGWVKPIRCKDCRYAHMTYNGECKYCDFWQEDGGEALYLDGDFYCAAGERKDEATPGDGCGPDYCEIGGDDDAR